MLNKVDRDIVHLELIERSQTVDKRKRFLHKVEMTQRRV